MHVPILALFTELNSKIGLISGSILGLIAILLALAAFRHRKSPAFPTALAVIGALLATLGTLTGLAPSFISQSQWDALKPGLGFAYCGLLAIALIALVGFVFLRRSQDSESTQSGQNAAREHLKFAIDGTSDGLWDWNIAEDKVWFSPRMKSLLGFAPNEFPDQFEAWEKRLHPDDHKATIDAIEQHLENDIPYDVTYRLKCKDESYRWFRARGQATRSSQGRPLRMAGAIQDIEDQHQDREKVQQNEELFRAVFEKANIGIALTDRDGKFCEVNPALCKMLKYDEASLKLRSFKSVTHPDDLDRSTEMHDSLKKDNVEHLEIEKRYLRKDGDILHAITGISRLKTALSGSGAQTLVHIQDVTKLKNAERKAVESSQFKSQFLAHMSHEIRTPLGGLLGMIELALGTTLTDEQEHFLVTAKRSSEQLMFLINDILDLSKIEAGKLEIHAKEFDIREATSTMISTLSLRAHEKNLELAYHIDDAVPQRVSADWSRIQQVLTNLLSNAIKFTPQGQVVLEIRLDKKATRSAAASDQENTLILFSVSDTGIGIPAEKCREIFEAFHHADTSIPQKYGGTGLGLAISQELVGLMQGKIAVESELGSGSRFSFSLPVRALEQASQVGTEKHQRNFEGLKALIVDDNETSLEFLSKTLLQCQITPTGFTSTKAAESFLRSDLNRDEEFDLCLLDSRIPGNENFQFPSRIANHLKEAANVILLLSSPNRELELERCKAQDLQHTLTKPVSSTALLALLDQLIHPSEKGADSQEAAAKKILVVEDNPINSEVAMNFIKQFGHEVSCVENGREAISTLEHESFDIVLMDLQMPEMSGLEATRIIREREKDGDKHQWIIALTAQAMKGDREECLAAGMDDYVTKPIKRENLQSAIERAEKKSLAKTVSSTPANADPSSIIQAFEGEINVAKKVGQIFLETTPSLWDAILQAIKNGDARTLKTSAHRLKGSFMQFGAEEAEQLAFKLETAGKNGELEGLDETVSRLSEETRDLKKQIYQLLRH